MYVYYNKEKPMESLYQHKILVVDDDKKTGKILKNFFQEKKIKSVFVANSDLALEEIKNSEKPFSVIIATQDQDSMTGTQLLEQARKTIPDTARVLMTSHSQINTIIQAVNKGAIQNYIVKPWTEESLEKAIKSSIKIYDLFLEDKKLAKLAKKQSTILYEHNCNLLESTKSHDKTILDLDNNIETLKKEIKTLLNKTADNTDEIIDAIQTHVKTDTSIDSEKTKTLYIETIKLLYDKFNDISQRNGFEMPEIKCQKLDER